MVWRGSAQGRSNEADNDSFAPRITPNGRFVAFESFATNLARWNPSGEDVFIRDLVRHRTALVNRSSGGEPRGKEFVAQLLQRPSVTDDGSTVSFTTTSRWFMAGDTNRAEDVFVRTDPFEG